MLFDHESDPSTRMRLATLIDALSTGPDSLSASTNTPIPACPSPVTPTLVLDDETDPPVTANLPLELQLRADPSRDAQRVASSDDSVSERRRHGRGSFTRMILAHGAGSDRVLLGRNISAGGMQVEVGISDRAHAAA